MIDVLVPEEQEGTQAVVRTWLKRVGDRVDVNDPLVELETDKVAMEVPAPVAGVLREIVLETDARAVPGAVLGRIAEEGEQPVVPAEAGSPGQECTAGLSEVSASPGTEMRLSPSVRRALLQHDIDPSRIEGSGRGGRITRADVDRAVEAATKVEPVVPARPGTSAGPAQPIRPEVPASAGTTGIASHSVPHDRMRLKIAENMLASVTRAPHVTAVFEADFSAIIAHRQRHREAFERKGVKLTYTAYIVAAAAEAMKVAPAINSRWHDDRLEIFDDINVGVGTALGEKGLIVPVLRKVQTLSLKGIAAGLDELVEKARREQLAARDVSGGTFTISNHGVSGSLFAAPIIINQPQSAILGIGKLEKRVVVREVAGADSIQIRPMAYVSLTIDHRVVDGHQTNAWLSRFVELIEGWPAE
ncbi:MAG TPA: 2-oxo acid dehydrogenase subunit E2 [Allosphingosinicella sp.]|jgi:2-oxoglutarate dehydrogenase E2 component (dihydrolipoamide succinyltransferase)|nr:2-oxo acid dehydrogenase subunit E2 [Allosphingosinicella sp.]